MPKQERIVKAIFTCQSAQVTMTHSDSKTAKLSNLYSQERGKGHATSLLEEVMDYADKNGISLWLEVQRYGNPRNGLDNSQLIRLYEKFGFDVLEDRRTLVMMGRYPLERREE